MENNQSENKQHEISRPPRRQKRIDYIAAILANIILLYVFNSLLRWGLPFLTPSFTASLWILNVSLSATIIANLIFLTLYREPWFKALLRLFLNGLGLVFLYLLYLTFPFDFSGHSGNWSFVFRTGIVLGMVGVSIGIIVEFLKLMFNKD